MNLRPHRSRVAAFYQAHGKEWLGSLLLLPLCLYFALNRGEYTLFDSADLVIHEAGHFFLRPFGRFLTFAGGAMMQIVFPSIIAWYFWRHAYRFGVQVSLLWLGQNLINISVYAADARTRILPLLGGDASQHDWWNMLSMTGLLAYDQLIGQFFFWLGLVIFVALLLLPIRVWA